MQLAAALNIPPEQALGLYYTTRTARQLADPATGLQLMSDGYILEDLLAELKQSEGK